MLLQGNQCKCPNVHPKCGSSPVFRKVLNLFNSWFVWFRLDFLIKITSLKGVCANVSLAEHSLLLCLAKYISAFEL